MTYRMHSNIFQRNYAELSGGAVYVAFSLFKEQAFFSVTNTSFKDNHAEWKGGALFCEHNDQSQYNFELKLSGVGFTNNTAKNGGAVYVLRSKMVTLKVMLIWLIQNGQTLTHYSLTPFQYNIR